MFVAPSTWAPSKLRRARLGRVGRALAVCSLSLGSACDVVPLDDEGGSGEVPDVVEQAFADNCGLQGCHAGGTPAGGLSLEPGQIEALIGGSTSSSDLPLVEIGNVHGSYLALKMLPESARPAGVSVTGAQMPPGGGGNQTGMALIMAWIAGADVAGADGPPPQCFGPQETPMAVTFAEHVYPIIQKSCALPGCHDSGSDGLAFPPNDPEGAAAQIVSVVWNDPMMFVDPGSPDNSYVWHKLAGTHFDVPMGTGFRMPFGGEMCTDDLLLINKWIVQGAN